MDLSSVVTAVDVLDHSSAGGCSMVRAGIPGGQLQPSSSPAQNRLSWSGIDERYFYIF